MSRNYRVSGNGAGGHQNSHLRNSSPAWPGLNPKALKPYNAPGGCSRAWKHAGMLKTLSLPSDSYRTAHSKPHHKVEIFSGIRYAFHVQSRLKEPIAVMLGIPKVRRFAPQKTGTCCTIKTQSLKDGFQSRLPQQATSRKQRGIGSATFGK